MRRTLGFLLLALLTTTTALAKDKYQRPGPIHLTHDGEKWAEKTLHKLTLEEKVGQVFMIWCRASFLNVENPEYLQLLDGMQQISYRLVCNDGACRRPISVAQRTLRSS